MNIKRLKRLHEIVIKNRDLIDDTKWETCFLGFACKDEDFINQGLVFKGLDNGTSLPYFDNWWTFDAGAAFFNITLKESLNLFSSKRIRSLESFFGELIRLISSEQQPCGAD